METGPDTAMNVKISIELSERQLEFARRKVREGAFASVSDVVAEGLRDLMLAEQAVGSADDPLLRMRDEIRRRMATPDDQWVSLDESDRMFERLETRLKEKHGTAG